MDINLFRGIVTAIMLVLFIGVCIWAYSRKRRKDFEEAANLPFRDDKDSKAGDDK